MSAGPEYEHQTPPDKPALRAAWLGSRRVAVMAAVIGVGILAGAGVAVAATSGSTPTPAPSASAPSATPRPPALPGKGKGPWHIHASGPYGPPFAAPGMLGGGLLGGGLFGAVHGTVVVPKAGGGYQTVAFQNGKVTAVSSTSITLRSADGYSHTYSVTSSTIVNAQRDGIGSIKTGNQVVVDATVSGSTTTVVRIIDVTQIQQRFHNFFGGSQRPNARVAVPNS